MRKKALRMFTMIAQPRYKKRSAHGHMCSAEDDTGLSCSFAGAVFGSEIIRIRAVRAALPDGDEPRYQLADGGAGTLPYHSWIVAKGDEEWPDVMDEAEARTT